MLRRRTDAAWHGQAPTCDEEAGRGKRTCAEKIIIDIGWSEEKKYRGCDKEDGTEKHRLNRCASWREARHQIPEGLGKLEQRAKNIE